ncbi:hypothetical protein OROMI_024053 [Orobanche minor]
MKLIEYNHLEGDPGLDGGKNTQLFADILDMACSSVDNSSPDSVPSYLEPEAHSKVRSNPVVEELSSSDNDEPNMSLTESLPMKQINNAAEEIQSLVGGTDIKGLEAVLENAVDLEDGAKVTRYEENI